MLQSLPFTYREAIFTMPASNSNTCRKTPKPYVQIPDPQYAIYRQYGKKEYYKKAKCMLDFFFLTDTQQARSTVVCTVSTYCYCRPYAISSLLPRNAHRPYAHCTVTKYHLPTSRQTAQDKEAMCCPVPSIHSPTDTQGCSI